MVLGMLASRFMSTGLPSRLMLTSSCQMSSQVNSTESGRPDDLYRYLWLKCSSHEVGVLDSYEKFLKMAAENLDVDYLKTDTPWRTIKRRTLLASRHVHKKYRVQYEIRSYYRNLLFKNLTGSTLETFLEYVERNLPEGVMLIVEKHKLAELPFDLEPDVDNKV